MELQHLPEAANIAMVLTLCAHGCMSDRSQARDLPTAKVEAAGMRHMEAQHRNLPSVQCRAGQSAHIEGVPAVDHHLGRCTCNGHASPLGGTNQYARTIIIMHAARLSAKPGLTSIVVAPVDCVVVSLECLHSSG